uniref:ZAD domain-containing protein n=1 Tax=Timema douglasi TaxID=61478 RepID=A0A7R8ZCC0_TIMDO|nr:unnamed protein product [Timema douglasi]
MDTPSECNPGPVSELYYSGSSSPTRRPCNSTQHCGPINASIGSQQNIPRQRIVSPVLKLQKCRYLLNEQFDSALQVSEQDGLPDQVCVSCAYHVDKYLEFKEQCQASDWKLRQRLISVDQEQEIIVIKEEADLKDAHDLTSYRRPTRPMLSRTSDVNVPTLQDVPSVRSVGLNESKLDDVTRYRDFLTCVNVGVCPDDQPDYKELSDNESNASTVVVGNLDVALHQDLDEAATLVRDFPLEQKHLISFPSWTHEDCKPIMSGENSDDHVINDDRPIASAQSIQVAASIKLNEESLLGTPNIIYKEKLESEFHTDYVVQDNALMSSDFPPHEGEEASRVSNKELSLSTKERDAATRYHQYKTAIDKVLEMLEDSSPSILSLADRAKLEQTNIFRDEQDSKEDLMISLKNLRKPPSHDNPTRTKHSNIQESQNSWDTCEESLETIYNYVNEGEKWPLNVCQGEALNENIILASLSHTNSSVSQDKKLKMTDGSYKNHNKHVHSDIGRSSDSKTDVRQSDNITAIFSVAIPLPLSKTAKQLSESRTTQDAKMAGDYRYGRKTRATQTTCKRKRSAENPKRASGKRKKLSLEITPIAPETNLRNISKLAKTCNLLTPSVRMTNNSLNTSEIESDANIWFNIESLYYDTNKHKYSSSAGEMSSVYNSSNSPEVINAKENGNDAHQPIENTILSPTKSADKYRKNSKTRKKPRDNMLNNRKLKERMFFKDSNKNKEVFENTKDPLNKSERELTDNIVVESSVQITEIKDKDVLICNKLLEETNLTEMRTFNDKNKPSEIMSTQQHIRNNQSGGKSLTEIRLSQEGKAGEKENKRERRTSTERKIGDKESKTERRTSTERKIGDKESKTERRTSTERKIGDKESKTERRTSTERKIGDKESKTERRTSTEGKIADKESKTERRTSTERKIGDKESKTERTTSTERKIVNNATSDIMNTSNVLNKTSNFNSIISSTHLKGTSSDDKVVCAASQGDNSPSSATTQVQHPETKLTKCKSADLDKTEPDRNSPTTLFALKSDYKRSTSNVPSTETKPVKYAGSYVGNRTTKSETNQKQDYSNHLVSAEEDFRQAKQSRWGDTSSSFSAFDYDSYGYDYKESNNYDYRYSDDYNYKTGYRDNSRLSLEQVDYFDKNATYDLLNYEDSDVNNSLIPYEFTGDDEQWFRYSPDRVPYEYRHDPYQTSDWCGLWHLVKYVSPSQRCTHHHWVSYIQLS